MKSSSDTVVLVTGGSSGVGRACCERLARRCTVYGTSRDPAFAPDNFHPLHVDVTSDESVRRGVATLLEREQRIDVLINNAGYGLGGAVEDTSIDEALHQIDTNLLGVLRMVKAVLPAMRMARSGLIVNVTSVGGAVGLPFQGLYSASKFAVEGLTESLRQEVAQFGIRVVAVQPGDLRTGITRNRVVAHGAASGASAYGEAFVRTLAIVEREEGRGAAPDLVASLVERLIRTRAPKVRYSVGYVSQRSVVVAKTLLPSRLFERALMAFYRVRT